jgi:hypothetical protein
MTENAKKDDELTALIKRDVAAELERRATPKKDDFVPMSDEQHRDMVHQMRERQANSWMPPDAIREMVAAEPPGFMKGVIHDNRAPTGRPGMIPEQPSQRSAPANVKGTGWVDPTPLSNPPGTQWVDAIAIADDVRQRAERSRKG